MKADWIKLSEMAAELWSLGHVVNDETFQRWIIENDIPLRGIRSDSLGPRERIPCECLQASDLSSYTDSIYPINANNPFQYRDIQIHRPALAAAIDLESEITRQPAPENLTHPIVCLRPTTTEIENWYATYIGKFFDHQAKLKQSGLPPERHPKREDDLRAARLALNEKVTMDDIGTARRNYRIATGLPKLGAPRKKL